MANEFNNLGPILQAIGRQIAERRATSARGDRHLRDLPILLLPHELPAHAASERHRGEHRLPYLMGEVAESAESAPSASSAPTARPQRKEGAYPRLNPDLGGSHA